jgi:P-type conjugative transfer protein TrbJ
MKKRIFFLIIAAAICNVSLAFAGGGMSGGALETTQLANKAQLIKQVAEAVEQTQQLIHQYQNMLQNTLQLPMSIWNDVTKTFTDLQNLMNSAQSLSLGAAFDFDKFKIQHPGYRELVENAIDFAKLYRDRVNQWQDFAKVTLQANNMAVSDIKDDQQVIKKLHDQSRDSIGQMQALQAGNEIATFMSQEIAKMRMDMARQIDLQTEVAQNEEQIRADEQAAFENAVGTWKEDSTPIQQR